MARADTPVDGAPARPPELVERLKKMKYSPVEPGGDWPDIGQQAGTAGSDGEQSLAAAKASKKPDAS